MDNRNGEIAVKNKFKEIIHQNVHPDVGEFTSGLFNDYDFGDKNEKNEFITKKLAYKNFFLMINNTTTPNTLYIIAKTNSDFNVLHELMERFLNFSPSLISKHDLKSFENIVEYRNFCTTIPLDKHNLDTLIQLFDDENDAELRSAFTEIKNKYREEETRKIKMNQLMNQLTDRLKNSNIVENSKKNLLKQLKPTDIGFVLPETKIKNHKTEQYQCADMSKILMIFPKKNVEDLMNLLATLGSTNVVNIVKEIDADNCIIDISIAIKYESGKREVAHWVENFVKLTEMTDSPFLKAIKHQIDLINKQRNEYRESVDENKRKLFEEIYPKDKRNYSKIILSMTENFDPQFRIQQHLSLPYTQCRERFILGDELTIFVRSELTKLTNIDFQNVSIEWEPERIFQMMDFYPSTSNFQKFETQGVIGVQLCPGWEHGLTVEPINTKLLNFYSEYEGRDTRDAKGFIVIPFENLALFYVLEYAFKNVDQPEIYHNALKAAANLIRQYHFNMIVPEKYQQILFENDLLTSSEREKIQAKFTEGYRDQISLASQYKDKVEENLIAYQDIIDVEEEMTDTQVGSYQTRLTLYQPAPSNTQKKDQTPPSPEKKV